MEKAESQKGTGSTRQLEEIGEPALKRWEYDRVTDHLHGSRPRSKPSNPIPEYIHRPSTYCPTLDMPITAPFDPQISTTTRSMTTTTIAMEDTTQTTTSTTMGTTATVLNSSVPLQVPTRESPYRDAYQTIKAQEGQDFILLKRQYRYYRILPFDLPSLDYLSQESPFDSSIANALINILCAQGIFSFSLANLEPLCPMQKALFLSLVLFQKGELGKYFHLKQVMSNLITDELSVNPNRQLPPECCTKAFTLLGKADQEERNSQLLRSILSYQEAFRMALKPDYSACRSMPISNDDRMKIWNTFNTYSQVPELRGKEFKYLKSRSYISDLLLDVMLQHLFLVAEAFHQAKTLVIPSHLFSSISNDIINATSRQLERKSFEFSQLDLLVSPVCHSNHWMCYLFIGEKSTLGAKLCSQGCSEAVGVYIHIDPFNHTVPREEDLIIIQTLAKTLDSSLNGNGAGPLKVVTATVPKQVHSGDCGFYIVATVLHLLYLLIDPHVSIPIHGLNWEEMYCSNIPHNLRSWYLHYFFCSSQLDDAKSSGSVRIGLRLEPDSDPQDPSSIELISEE
ncbi:hypothetical protein GMRT_11037 [Giardia muris]|uniref:Ubiquitin-like protease family profile domain-containing protein n=1 Tax=Giardia muris TaxID=5742 RepID=A0A4Z1SQH9_GIAMU|nr:hypothetical protein GMRT_11037 [Giardia muris]|eukprot:TNJ27175.1 hypothetical protein GMRT_11037 [Giardia muris]